MTCHKVGMTTYVKVLGSALQKFGRAKKSKIWSDIGQLSSLTANILETDRDQKSETNLIDNNPRWVQRKKIGELWFTNQKSCRRGC